MSGMKEILARTALRAEDRVEATTFGTRWVLAPAYLVLLGCLALLTYKTYEEFVPAHLGSAHL